jgi:hypothetical protein
MSSTSGTSTMASKSKEKRLLNADEVCSILRTCAESGVASLKLGDLHVTFGKPAYADVQLPDPRQQPSPDTEISDQAQKIEAETRLKDEVALKEEEIAFSLVEDPLAYERAILRGELTDGEEAESR